MIDILKIKLESVKCLLWIGGLLYLVLFILIGFSIWDSANIIFLITQLIFVPLFSLIIMYLLYDLFGTTNSTFLLTYYRGRVGSIYFLCFGLYLIPLFILCFFIKMNFAEFDLLAAITLLFSQIMLFSSISIVLFIIITDISIILSASVLYISAELATFGSAKYFYHLFYMNMQEPITFSNVSNLIFLNLLIGIVGYRLMKSVTS